MLNRLFKFSTVFFWHLKQTFDVLKDCWRIQKTSKWFNRLLKCSTNCWIRQQSVEHLLFKKIGENLCLKLCNDPIIICSWVWNFYIGNLYSLHRADEDLQYCNAAWKKEFTWSVGATHSNWWVADGSIITPNWQKKTNSLALLCGFMMRSWCRW